MKIKTLILGQDLFFPENKNGLNKTTYNLLKTNECLDVEFIYPSTSLDAPLDIPAGFEHVKLSPQVVSNLKGFSFKDKVWSIFRLQPFICDSQTNIEVLAKEFLLKSKQADLLIIVGLQYAGVINFLPKDIAQKVILIPIDCLSFFYQCRIKNENNPVKKLIWFYDSLKAKLFERNIYKKVKKSIFVSSRDASWATQLSSANCIGLPYGVDFIKLDQEVKSIAAEDTQNDMIFTGNFDYSPNINGALFLIEKVMPILRKKGIQVRLVIAGANPCEEIKKYASEDIIVTGQVASLAPYILRSKIFLSPIFLGHGVKTKVLEAMYFKSLVLGTPESFWAITGKDGNEFIQVDDKYNPNAWTEKIEQIINYKNQFEHIGKNAHASIERFHSWNTVRKLYLDEFIGN